MKLTWIENSRIALFSALPTEVESPSGVDYLLAQGASVLVTIDQYEYRLCWRHGGSRWIRRFFCPFENCLHPGEWELANLLHFFDYEIRQGRAVALWFAKDEFSPAVVVMLSEWLKTGNIPKIQPPETLNYCAGCLEKSCRTKMVCHTASLEDAIRIFQSGRLQSAVLTRGIPGPQLANELRNAAGDPPDYFNYVMFAWGNCIAGQRLVNERRLGRNPTQEELMNDFVPGVSFYFDRTVLESHSRFVDDGYHPCKIKDFLELEPYLLAVDVQESHQKDLLPFIPESIEKKLINVYENNLWRWCSEAWKKCGKVSIERSDSKTYPKELIEKIGPPVNWAVDTTGCSDAVVAFIPEANAWVKYGINEIAEEKNAYLFLKDQVRVPEVLYFQEYKNNKFLLMSPLKGKSLIHPDFLGRPEHLVKGLAEALTRLHRIDISNCPLNRRIDQIMAKQDLTAQELQWLTENRSPEDLVFTHGDACLPNFIMGDDMVCGYLDMGFAGVADRWQDLSLALWSLAYNLKTKDWGKPFIEAYGIELDQKKLEFFLKLNRMDPLEVY